MICFYEFDRDDLKELPLSAKRDIAKKNREAAHVISQEKVDAISWLYNSIDRKGHVLIACLSSTVAIPTTLTSFMILPIGHVIEVMVITYLVVAIYAYFLILGAPVACSRIYNFSSEILIQIPAKEMLFEKKINSIQALWLAGKGHNQDDLIHAISDCIWKEDFNSTL
jgi:hypothetical protein